MAKKQSSERRYIIQNRKAGFQYYILEKLECGIALKGTEVKSLRDSKVNIEEAFGWIKGNELWLMGCNISPYEKGTSANHDPVRQRKLLARRREILKWLPQVKAKGLTLVPLNIFFNTRGLAKVTMALVQGKTFADKRQTIRKREDEREIRRATRRGGT